MPVKIIKAVFPVINLFNKLFASNKIMKILLIFILIFSYSSNLSAYVGPGAGITALGALVGVILAILFVLGGLLIWPIRIFLRRLKGADAEQEDAKTGDVESANEE